MKGQDRPSTTTHSKRCVIGRVTGPHTPTQELQRTRCVGPVPILLHTRRKSRSSLQRVVMSICMHLCNWDGIWGSVRLIKRRLSFRSFVEEIRFMENLWKFWITEIFLFSVFWSCILVVLSVFLLLLWFRIDWWAGFMSFLEEMDSCRKMEWRKGMGQRVKCKFGNWKFFHKRSVSWYKIDPIYI